MRGKDPYNFTDKIDSKKGIVATGLSIVSIVCFLALVAYAVKTPLSIQQSLIGVYAFFLAIGAFFLAIGSFKEEETKAKYKIIGTIISSFAILCYVALIFI